MRPINLIPKDLRRGDAAPSRTGATGWVIVGALALAVVAAVMLVTTSNTLSERENEVAALRHAEQVAQREAAEYAPYTAFQQTVSARRQTIAGLAGSRFDWERVMRELALIIPEDIVIGTLTATVSPDVSVPGATSVDLRGSVPGPALELTGCAVGPTDRSQEAIARFISALYDIDGVTRVGMKDAIVTEEGDSASEREGDGAGTCSGAQISNFQMVAAFDSAPLAPTDGTIPEPPPEGPSTGESGSTTEAGDQGTTSPDSGDPEPGTSGSGAGQDQGTGGSPAPETDDPAGVDNTARASAQEATDKANKAKDTFLPGGGK